MSYLQVPLSLTEKQFHRLRQGYSIQLTHAQLKGQSHWLAVHPETHKKMRCAHNKQKGCRISMTPGELEASGEGIREFVQKMKNAGQWVKSHIIDTPFYQTAIKPVVRGLVNTGQTMVTSRLGPVAPIANMAIDAFGKRTGAYGILPHQPQVELSENYQKLLSPSHPAMFPGAQMPRSGGRVYKKRGGSFKPA